MLIFTVDFWGMEGLRLLVKNASSLHTSSLLRAQSLGQSSDQNGLPFINYAMLCKFIPGKARSRSLPGVVYKPISVHSPSDDGGAG